VCAACGADTGWLAVVDDEGGALRALASVGRPTPGRPRATLPAWPRVPADAPLPTADAARDGRPRWYPTNEALAEEYPHHSATMRALGIEAAAVLPLRAGERTLGVMALGFRAARPFGDDDRAFAEALAQQCASALERTLLFTREAAARARAEAEARRVGHLQELTTALSCAVTPADVAAVALGRARPTFGAAGGFVNLVTPDGREFVQLAVEGFTAEQVAPWRRYPVTAGTSGGEAARTGEPVFVSSLDECARRFPVLHAPLAAQGYESFATLPLRGDGRVIGLVAFNFAERRDFPAEERALLTAFAGQCALALERARLYEAERAARAAAEAANVAKAQFLATMSHELRTPLNAIDGYAELLELGVRGPLTEAQLEDVRRIRRSQKHLLALINDVLGFARLESGRVEFDIGPVAVDAALAALQELVAPQLRAKGLSYAYRGAPAALRARADADKLRQVVLNLLANAIKFTERGGVEVSCAPTADTVAVAVRDTGRGVPAYRLAEIFEPFVQVEPSLTRTATGTGLGLTIARDLARRMGGDVTVESAEGVGSTFTLTLPRA
jgi:signal transduction histidine kinase